MLGGGIVGVTLATMLAGGRRPRRAARGEPARARRVRLHDGQGLLPARDDLLADRLEVRERRGAHLRRGQRVGAELDGRARRGHRLRLAPPHLLRLRARGRGPRARPSRRRTPPPQAGLPASWSTRRRCPTASRRRCASTDQAEFHPRKYLLGLAEGLTDVYENSRATTHGQRRGPAGQDARRARPGEHGGAGDALSRSWTARWPSRGCTRSAPTRSCAGSPRSRRPGCSSPPARPRAPSALCRWTARSCCWSAARATRSARAATPRSATRRSRTFAREHWTVESVEYRWSSQDNTTVDQLPYVGARHPAHRPPR